MANDVGNPLDPSTLSWIEQAVGTRLLSYLLGCSTHSLEALSAGELQPTAEQVQVVSTLTSLRVGVPAGLDDASIRETLCAWLTQLGTDGRSVARSLHDHTSDQAETPSTAVDDIGAALAVLALDVYPAFLLPPDPAMIPFMDEFNIRATILLHQHPKVAVFADAVRRDSFFKSIFEEGDEHTGPYATIYRNTGSFGSLQLAMFPEILLRSAWRHLDSDIASPSVFVAQALDQLRLVREVLAGNRRTIAARLGLMGVLLPPAARLQLPVGTVRSVSEADRKLVPETLKGQLSGTDDAGNTTVVNYDGDMVLEYDFPYAARVANRPLGAEVPPWPQDMRPPAELEQVVMRLRFSLLLAVERQSRAQIVPTWRYYDEPLSYVRAISWSDPRLVSGIMPTRLSEAEVSAWREWYDRLSTPQVGRIELALSRILRAMTERREPSDVLIDSVIAWENLFGTKEGEPTFRVTMCLAVLLEDSLDARTKLRRRLTSMYALRSKLVHGSDTLKEVDHTKCREALDIAIRAIRVLTTVRVDILQLPDGAARSETLLLKTSRHGTLQSSDQE